MYIYNVIRSVHITQDKFENAALFLRLRLPSTLIRTENGPYRKRSSNRRNLKTSALRLRVNGKHFENRAFRQPWRHDNHVISLTEVSSKTNPKWAVIVAFVKSYVVWTGPEKPLDKPVSAHLVSFLNCCLEHFPRCSSWLQAKMKITSRVWGQQTRSSKQ